MSSPDRPARAALLDPFEPAHSIGPSRPRPAGARHFFNGLAWIAVVSARLWIRDTTRALGLSPRVILVLLGGLFVVLGAGSALLASIMPSFATDDVPPDALAAVRHLSAALLWTIGGLLAMVFQLLAPRRTSLSEMLALLPVSRTLVAVASQLPVLGVSLVVMTPLLAPTVRAMVETTGHGYPLAIVAVLLLVVGLLPLLALLFNAVVPALLRLRVPIHHALAGGGLVCMAVSVFPVALEFSDRTVTWLPHGALAASAAGDLGYLAYLAVWAIVGLTLFVLLAGLLPNDPRTMPNRALSRLGVPDGSATTRLWYEVVTLIRAPQYAAVIMFTWIIALATFALFWITESEWLTLLAGPLLLPLFFASLQSYGHTRGSHWLGSHLLAQRAPWSIPKMAACLGVAFTLSAPLAVLAVVSGLAVPDAVPMILLQAMPAWSAAMVAGLVVPYSTEQPLSVGLSLGLAGALYMGGLWTIGELPGDLPAPVGLLALTLIYISIYLLVGRNTRLDVRPV